MTAPLHGHMAGNGRVDPAGKQRKNLGIRTDRKTSRTFETFIIDKSNFFPDFNADGNFRMIEIYFDSASENLGGRNTYFLHKWRLM